MEKLEKLLKRGLLYVFCLLNAIDMVQTMSFLRMGIESNLFVVHSSHLWFPLKFLFTFGLSLVLYKLDVFLEGKEEVGSYHFLKSLVRLTYLVVLVADVFYFSLVLRNFSVLRRFV